ncbi:sigma-54 interaction domain-containing protein [Desulfatitalea alkaliphila]|uniref:Sigma 54-interacting transcriptional regulator n=1 Tax=Desulfatitalea alkaliphila TaxID=2929485 RepID=A0AA41R791_9BACT|nr:sigma 54-interacting transcriptional regulator [Desulfatitalea alkaliphila]MCJ8502520.1 sigma 54-interacting transcriptional regulator [Desulfatitalea alkaliphila]
MKRNDDKQSTIPPHVTQTILESISDGVFTVDHDWRITSFNRAAERITGMDREQAIGRYCWDVFRSNMCETDCALKRTMRQGKAFVDSATYIVNSQQQRIPVVVSTSVLQDGDGNVLGGVEVFRDVSQVEELRKALEGRYRVGDIVSRSPSMQRIFKILPQVALSDSTVLIQGETGTGKELLAKAIHSMSPRAKSPFVAINCGALPDTLLESELFGYKAGAFTHATRDKAGHFAMAEGGTLLLDEISELSPAFQVRLLRVLQEKCYQPLGATRTQKADVRVVAATNRHLAEMVRQGSFRQDLFYRVNVVCLDLPPLRERKEDIPMLVEHFIGRMNRIHGKSVQAISQEALSLLMFHNYPGNIRELENIIEHAFVLCPTGEIGLGCLPESLLEAAPRPSSSVNLQSAIQSTEARVIMDALERNNFNRLAAARELNMHKSTLYRKIKKIGVQLPEMDGRSGNR